MGYTFATLAAPGLAPFMAFALGAFPLTALQALLRRFAKQKLAVDPTDEAVTNDIIKFQGINRDIEKRLAKEDITSITQFAYCNPVQLMMRSSLAFEFVTDCMNQALARMYLRTDRPRCAPWASGVPLRYATS